MSTTGATSNSASPERVTGKSTSTTPLAPREKSPLDVSKYPVAPTGLELAQVQVFVRHGERTPVGIRLSKAPASIPEHWMVCKTARRLKTALSPGGSSSSQDGDYAASLAGTDGVPQPRDLLDILNPRVVERLDGKKEEGECLLGELTDVGRQSTYNYGKSLRSIYVDKLGFLPDSLHDSSDDEEGPVPKILVHSTHDTALAGLCSTLDVFDEKWPEFTASITFELFKKVDPAQANKSYLQSFFSPFSKTPSQFFVRMRYQNRSLPLPFCSAEGKHLDGSPEFCTLEAFKERVKELTPEDWENECSPAGRS